MVNYSLSDKFIEITTGTQLCGTIRDYGDHYEIWTPASVTHVVKWQDDEYWHGTYERDEAASFKFYTTDLMLAERNIVAALCDAHRSANGMPRLDYYRMARTVKPGFQSYMLTQHYSTIRNLCTGTAYPMRIFEFMDTPLKATRLSHIVTVPVEELFASYMDPGGAPLFSHFIYKRPQQ